LIALFEFLQDKLEFIGRFYDTAAEPSETDLKKIEEHEEPYDTFGDIEDDEPPFLSQWLDDTESLNLLGKACLCLVQSAFRSYLDGFIIRSGQEELLGPNRTVNVGKAIKGGNSFEKYQRTFLEFFGIDWQASPSLPLVEEVNLARNRIEHGGTFYDLSHKQDPVYFSRFPESVFADEFEKAYFGGDDGFQEPRRISVTRENLHIAIEGIKSFCDYLEREWQKRGL